ncbi:MAG: ComEC/Rec2 family competence protein [Phycisphaerales bacterium]
MDVDASASGEREEPRRGLVAFACFAGGLAAGDMMPGSSPALWFGVACAAAATALLASGRVVAVMLGAGALAFAGGWIVLRAHQEPADSLARLSGTAPVAPVLVRGTVLDVPHAEEGAGARAFSRFTLGVREAETRRGPAACRGVCEVFVAGRVEVRPGERVEARGFFVPVSAPMNPGERDERPWARQEGRAGRISVESAELVRAWGERAGVVEAVGMRVRRAVWELRGFAGRALAGTMGAAAEDEDERSRGSALIGALILGRTDPALRPVAGALSRLGQVHVLSISGFHLAVMAALALFVIRLTGERGWVEPALVAGLVVLYLLVVPAQAPILRSGFMVLALLAAEATGRRYDRLNLLGWIAIALLVWRPMDLWSAGFQLSFGVTGALVWLGARFHRRVFEPRIVGRLAELQAARDPGLRSAPAILWTWTTGLVSTSVLCWLVATPTVMHHVGIVSPAGAASSVILVPVFTLALWLGFVLLVAGALWPAAGSAAGAVLEGVGEMAARLALALDGLPFMAVNVPPVSAGWAACATVVAVLWVREPRRPRWEVLAAGAIVLAWLVWMLASAGGVARGAALRVDALATGDSSAVIVRAAESDQAVLWIAAVDEGSASALRRTVAQAARALRCWRVRTIIIGGGRVESLEVLPELCQALGTRDVLLPAGYAARAAEEPGGAHGALMRGLASAGVRVRDVRGGDVVRIGAARIALHDPESALGGAETPGVLAAEIVGVHERGEARVLLMGHVRSAALAAASGAGFESVVAVELPARRLSREAEDRLRGAGVKLAWRSEGARLGARGERGPAGVLARSTGADGALWIEVSREGEVRHGVRLK